jgi:hypothetical protein
MIVTSTRRGLESLKRGFDGLGPHRIVTCGLKRFLYLGLGEGLDLLSLCLDALNGIDLNLSFGLEGLAMLESEGEIPGQL